MVSFNKEYAVTTDPKEYPAHRVPEEFPLPPCDLPPSTEPLTRPHQPQLAQSAGPYDSGEVEDESADPVGLPPRM